ncbi:SDR family NAD(P)-dependent oxidoreductase [Nocardia sp. NPDC088792]|uniref:SDR family NAD(P)-dependent oxidoreductase n=1 Tax=Nocardia sp. NPDC088792 TaxID=3364332 RepID=UPI0037F1526E
MNDSVSPQDSTALVTGANKGIGRHIAQQLADLGVTVYVGSRDGGRGQRVVDEIGGKARLLVLDVTDSRSTAAAVEEVSALDILVNNAGIFVNADSVAEVALDDVRRTFETNLFGVLAVTNAFLPLLRASARPRIVNISSGTGSLTLSSGPDAPHGTAGGVAYRSSKAALNMVTVLYARELTPAGFKVNALAPGIRATDLNDRAGELGGDPAEAAAAAVRLALLPDDGPTGEFHSWDGTLTPW